ncbi:MAG: ATP-binding protein [Myxococcota bacterium]
MREWWRPPVFSDEELNRRAAIVYPLVVVLTLTTPLTALISALTQPVAMHFMVSALAMTVAYAISLFALRRGYVSAAALGMVVVFTWDGLMPMVEHGLYSASFATFVLGLVIAGATLTFRVALGLALVGGLTLLMIGTSQAAGDFEPLPAGHGLQLQTYMIQLVITVFVVGLTTPAWRRWIRELRSREGELQKSRHQYAELIQHNPSGIIQLDQAGVIRLVNPSGAAILGIEANDLVGQPFIILESLSGKIVDLLRDARTRDRDHDMLARWRFTLRRSDRSERTVEATAGPIDDGVMATLVDVTDQERVRRIREELEQRKGHAMRLEALGRMAGGIAHDFNNLLTVIASGVDLVEEEADQLPELSRQDLGAIRQAARQAAELTGQLLAFGRRQPLDKRHIDGNEVLESVARLMRRTLGEHITLEVQPARGPCELIADPQQLERVLVNLITNARDALDGPGRITLGVGPDPADPTRIELLVSDTGHGMDEATREQIFEPFFTTKEPGRGTGLGLATVHGIVTQLGGNITVSSEVGEGSCFRLRLPAAVPSEVPTPTTSPRNNVAITHRPLSILLVEDEEPVRRLLGRSLERAGHQVRTARGVDEGLGAWSRHRSFDLLVTDVILADGTGPELVEGLRERGFEGPVLYVTGYPGEILDEVKLVTGSLLMKPFPPDDLVTSVERLWASGG